MAKKVQKEWPESKKKKARKSDGIEEDMKWEGAQRENFIHVKRYKDIK